MSNLQKNQTVQNNDTQLNLGSKPEKDGKYEFEAPFHEEISSS